MSKETSKKSTKATSEPKKKYGLKQMLKGGESPPLPVEQPPVQPAEAEPFAGKVWILELHLQDGSTKREEFPSRKAAVDALIASGSPWVLLRVAPEKPKDARPQN